MVSSTSMGERRVVSARKGGMHVLGKIIAPKPVNLPSQRLENQGLDPNVEIVPKGTLSWGSRSSSSAQNAWGPSALSPPATDTSVGSSSPLTGRPSSSGSVTRPSTAGSDRSHEHASSAWGPNSRPSSASGTLATNQAPVVLTRPRSAETRTGSSQLSRFAEPVAETSVAWVGPRMSVNLGTASTKHNEFTLSSGDFPTLGSETNSELHARRGSSHGRPVSSGGSSAQQERSTPPTGDSPVDASAEKGDVNTWRRETSPQTGDGTPMMEKWQDPQHSQPFPTVNMPSHHFDPWHGTPIQRSPNGVWYRGVPPGGPYRPAVPPGGYPLEPFGYYPPQLPYRPVSNSQAGPRPRAGPNSYQQKNGGTFCPRMPDSYIPSHPMIPLRPGFYPGPVPYDGYYGPPHMSFCNPNDRDAPSMGMTAGPYVCNPNQNVHPDSGNFNIRPGGYGPSSVMVKEQMEYTHSRDVCQGPYKVLLKQHDNLGGNDTEETREPSAKPMTQNDWIADCRKGEPPDFSMSRVEESHPELTSDQRKLSSVPAAGNLPDNNSKAKAVDDGLVKKPETAASIAQGPQHHPTIKKTPTLIDKIEGLNTKARIFEGRYESKPVSAGEENMKQFKVGNIKADHSTNESVSVFYNEDASSGSIIIQEAVDVSRGDKILESSKGGKVVSRQVEYQATSANMLNSSENREKVHSEIQKKVHGMQGRADFRGRGRFNIEGDEWRKKSLTVNSSVNVTTTNADAWCDTHVQDHHTCQEAPEKQEMNQAGKAGGGLHAISSFDSTDYQAQRAKMKEIATQRSKQLQKEEEERTREQKAKALAKLEELNKRTLAEIATQKLEGKLPHHEESHTMISQSNTSVPNEVTGVSCSDSDTVTTSEQSMSKPMEAMKHSPQGPVSDVNISVVPLNEEANPKESVAGEISSQIHDNSVFKQKQMGHKRKQHNSLEKNLGDKTATTGGTIVHDNAIGNPSASNVESGSENNSSSNDNVPLQLKKNRSTKSKQKMDEASAPVPSPSMAPMEGNMVKASDESIKPKTLEPISSEVSSIQPQFGMEIVKGQNSHDLVSVDEGWLQPTDEPHGRINNKLKPQHTRRISRNPQSFRHTEKLHGTEGAVWAPVRLPPNKSESSEVPDQDTTNDGGHFLGKDGYGTQNISKGKRADIERYVPKPVAKELSQQNSQNPPTPSTQAASKEALQKADYGLKGSKSGGQMDNVAVEKTDFAVENKNGNSNHNKQGRTHSSWRQRGSAESSMALQSSHGESVAAPFVVTDHGVAGRGRRHLPRVHRAMGYSHFPRNNKNLGAGMIHKADSWAPALDSDEADGSSERIENQGDVVYVSSHWQPKSQALLSHSQEERAGSGGQNVTIQVVRTSEKDFSSLQTTQLQAEKKNTDKIQHRPNQPKAQNSAAPLVNKNERKPIDTFKEHTKISHRGPPRIAEFAPENVDTHHEQQMISSEQRRQGPHNGRFTKQQEASYEGVQGDIQGQEAKQRLPTIGDRRKHNSHYEYQPIGSHNKPNDSFRHNPNVDAAPRDGARAVVVRYREKSQNQSRRGGHYGRNGGNATQVASNDNEE